MKKYISNILIKRIAGAALTALLISVNVHAAELPSDTASEETSATIQYVGTDDNSYLFHVAYANENGGKFLVRITDEADNVLFAQMYTDKKFDKRFRLMKDASQGRLNFVIRNLKNNKTQSFKVTTSSEVVEQVVVKKLN
jgi:hypothetical protein